MEFNNILSFSSKIRFEQFNKCLICKNTNIKPLKGYENNYLFECNKCNFVFSNRIPLESELKSHYQKYTRDIQLSEVTIKRFNELLDKFEYYRKNNRILDIGCGSGFFLEVAKNRGWQVFGTEYTVEAIEICNKKEISMHLGKLDPLWFDENFFDIIVSIEVIEHINNPLEELNNIKTILREGGLFYFTTPNFNSIERFILRDKYSVIEYPEHLSYYNSFSIKILLKKIGLKKIKITTTGISLNRLFFKKNRNPNGIINSENKDEFIRESLEKNRGLRFSKIVINFFLNLFGIGNSLKGWYTK